MKSPKVAIVTINWNGLNDTKKCIESAKKINYNNYEIVVVDNGSKNDEAQKIRQAYPGVTVLENEENLGFTGGCNTGIKHALKEKADYILLLNNDATVEKNFLRPLVEFYESEPRAGLVSPLILYSDKKTIWYSGGTVKSWAGIVRMQNKGAAVSEARLPKEPYMTGFACGAGLLISSRLVKKIGMLDDAYFAYYEDSEWSYRARRAGYESYVVPGSLIYHEKSASTGKGGRNKFGKIPAYYLARNGMLFSSQINGAEKVIYVLAQFFIKLPLSLILLIDPKAWSSYLKGLIAGTALLIRG